MKYLIIRYIMVCAIALWLAIPSFALLKLEGLLVPVQERGSQEQFQTLQPYCSYSLIHPITSRWDSYSWIEKRNYQAFFQNILAAYRFNTQTANGKILVYFSPHYINDRAKVQAVAEKYLQIKEKYASLGWILNKPEISTPYDIIVYILPLNMSSVVIPLNGELISDSYRGIPIIVINGNKLAQVQQNPCILSHAFAHAFLFAHHDNQMLWFEEAVSSWMETLIDDLCDVREKFYSYRLTHPEISLGASDITVATGDAHYFNLVNNTREGIIRLLLEEPHPVASSLPMLNEALLKYTDRSVADYYEEYSLTNYCEVLNRKVFSPESTTVFPISLNFSFQPMSTAYYKFQASGSDAIKLIFDSRNNNIKLWAFIVAPDHKIYVNPVLQENQKIQEFIFPWEKSSELYLVMISTSFEQTNFQVNASLVNDYPFVLDSFEASIGKSQVSLTWTTIKELDTLGWIVYRKREKDAEFKKINELLIPAAGNSNDVIKYLFIDRATERGTYYQYYIEVITRSKFPKKGPLIFIKMP